MKIRQKTELILGAFLLLTISCDCKPRPLGRGEDDRGPTLTTSAAKILGSVNNNPVIEVDGEIQENNSKETILGVLSIPDGYSIQDAADELRENKEPKTPDTYIALPKSNGFAYYAKYLKAGYTGEGSISAYSEKGTVQKDKTYMAHLVLGGKDVCFSPAGKPFNFKTPTAPGAPQVQMVSAGANKKITGTGEHIELELDGQADSVASNSQGGFLLIEQGDTELSPTKLIAALIQQKKFLPTGSGFQQFDGRQDAIIYPHATSITDNYTISETDVPDTTTLFKREATYQAYCYVVDTGNNYTISQNHKAINIGRVTEVVDTSSNPKPVVKLAMKEASIAELINAPDISTLRLTLEGGINRHEGTTNPTVGFCFAAGSPDKRAAIVQIGQLLNNNRGTLGSFVVDSTNIIYIAGSVAIGTVGTQLLQADASGLLPSMLGKDYTLYFWLRDDNGAVFVSDNSAALSVPKVTLTTELERAITKSGIPVLTLQFNSKAAIDKVSASSNTGYIFVKQAIRSNLELEEEDLRYILNYSKDIGVDSWGYITPRMKFFYKTNSSKVTDPQLTMLGKFTKYKPYYYLIAGKAIFCVAAERSFTTGTVDPPNIKSVPKEQTGLSDNYEVDMRSRVIYKVTDQNHKEKINLCEDNYAIMYEVLKIIEYDAITEKPTADILLRFGVPADFQPK